MELNKIDDVACLIDGYTDDLINLYNKLKPNDSLYQFPVLMSKKAKKVWKELKWMKDREWLSVDRAEEIWKEYESVCESWLNTLNKDLNG